MAQRIVWVHGIGDHHTGYSAAWQEAFNAHLNLAPECFLEVVWETALEERRRTTRGAAVTAPLQLTPRERLAESEARAQILAVLLAQASAVYGETEESPRRSRGGAGGVIEWRALQRQTRKRGVFDWLSLPNEYLGDFTKYIVSARIRSAIKEQLKAQLRPLAGSEHEISIIAHSWGTVVSYDTLIDLEVELPNLSVAHLFTLGSPLWIVRNMLQERSGRKPGQLNRWMNIDARGDLVGSWLSPAFDVDRDYQVPSFPPATPHGSYFVPGNEAVQKDLVAKWLLE